MAVARWAFFLGHAREQVPSEPPVECHVIEHERHSRNIVEFPMLHWALVFLVVALVAAVFGFGGIASTAAGMAQILFVVALVLFVVSLLFGFARRRNL